MALTLLKRLIKGSALTAAEHDANMTAIENAVLGAKYPIINGLGTSLAPYLQVSYASSTLILTANTLMMIPIVLDRDFNMSSMSLYVATAQAGSTFQIGIFDSDANGLPSAKLASSGNLDASTIGAKSFTQALSLQANKVYWLALTTSSSGTIATLRACTAQYCKPIGISNSAVYTCMTATPYSAIPATAPAVAMAANTLPFITIQGGY